MQKLKASNIKVGSIVSIEICICILYKKNCISTVKFLYISYPHTHMQDYYIPCSKCATSNRESEVIFRMFESYRHHSHYLDIVYV